MADTHRFVGSHVTELMIGGEGRMVEPGQFVTLNKDDLSANQEALDNGDLLDLKAKNGGDS